mgnify:CR=1 FL=1
MKKMVALTLALLMAASLFLSGCWLISSIGFSRAEICTGPLPLGGNFMAGSGTCTLGFLATGIRIGACDGCLVMIACLMILIVLIVNTRALAAR